MIGRYIVKREVCGGAEDMLDGAEGMPVEVGGVKEVAIGDGVDVFVEVGVRAHPVWDGFGKANGRGSWGADEVTAMWSEGFWGSKSEPLVWV